MKNKLPNNVGFMDGCHFRLEEAPSDDHESYYSRKQEYAIQMQAVVDHKRKFRDLHIGYPGSVHDARVFANSNLGRQPGLYLENGQWIAADSAYPLSEFVLTPFKRMNYPGTT